MFKRSILTACLLVLVALPLFAQTSAPKWIVLGGSKDLTFAVHPQTERKDGKLYGVTSNGIVASGAVVFLVWEIDCSANRARIVHSKAHAKDGTLISQHSQAGQFVSFDKRSYGAAAMNVWCGNTRLPEGIDAF
jgi:hypothetical protein